MNYGDKMGPYDISEIRQLASISNGRRYLERSEIYHTMWERETSQFRDMLSENEYGYKCYD